jgi:hypothetical protein
MTEKNCKICNKSIRKKGIYCSNKCKQINYLQNKKKKQNFKVVQEPTQTELFLRDQQINGIKIIYDWSQNVKSEIERNKQIRKEQDEYIKERKEFEKGLRALELKRKTEKSKLITNMFLSSLISKPNSNDIKLSDLQFPDDI